MASSFHSYLGWFVDKYYQVPVWVTDLSHFENHRDSLKSLCYSFIHLTKLENSQRENTQVTSRLFVYCFLSNWTFALDMTSLLITPYYNEHFRLSKCVHAASSNFKICGQFPAYNFVEGKVLVKAKWVFIFSKETYTKTRGLRRVYISAVPQEEESNGINVIWKRETSGH